MQNVLTRKRDISIRRITEEESAYLILREKIIDELFPEDGSWIPISSIPRKFRTLAARKVINDMIGSGELRIRYRLNEKSVTNHKALIIERIDCFLLKCVAVEYID